MQRLPVESSSIVSIGYVPHERVLELEFRQSGEVYQYFDVPAEDHAAFAALTGMPAGIDPNPGGAFKTFGGLIVGRNIELLPNQRIVQAWRPTHCNPGVYSIVKFELKPQSSGTKNHSRSHRLPRR